MKTIMEYLSCGNLRIESSMIRLRVSKFSDITDKIIPLLDKHSVEGIKYSDYLDFKRGAELIKSKAHLTPEGLAKIRTIKEGMNKGRDFIELTSDTNPDSYLVSNNRPNLGVGVGANGLAHFQPRPLHPHLPYEQKRSFI